MARGNEIVVSANPRGQFLEGLISGTPKPGTVMEIKNTALVNGRETYQAWSKASGARGLVAVLLPDFGQGKLGVGGSAAYTGGPKAPGDAYVDGTRGFLYVPANGEELNMIVGSVAGTADDVAIGDLFGVTTSTGTLIANSAYAGVYFTALEVVTDPTADYMLHCRFNS